MRHKIGMLLLTSTAMIGPAAAQNAGPNPAQVAAKNLLQAADKAIGASNVKSCTVVRDRHGWAIRASSSPMATCRTRT